MSWQQEAEEKVRQAVRTLADVANGWNAEKMGHIFADELQTQHRTLQQGVLGAVKIALHDYALGARFDARNEIAVNWAREVAKIENSDIRFPVI